MGRPRQHDEATGEALLDAAEELLAAGGPDAVSVRAVADAVGTTTRAVYSRFGSKDGLVKALAGRGYALLTEYVSGMPPSADPGADLVAVGLGGFRRFAMERPHLFRLTFERVSGALTATPAVAAAARTSYDALLVWIRRALEAGVLAPRDEAEIAFAFHSLCQGLASGELSRRPPPAGAGFWSHTLHVDAEDLWRTALEALVAGLGPAGRR